MTFGRPVDGDDAASAAQEDATEGVGHRGGHAEISPGQQWAARGAKAKGTAFQGHVQGRAQCSAHGES